MSPILTSLLLAVALSTFVWTMFRRMRPLAFMKKEDRLSNAPARAEALV